MRDQTYSPADLQQIYQARFGDKSAYRQKVWSVLCAFFSRWIPTQATVLDLGCGWCEFINTVQCSRKFAMDLNPDVQRLAAPGVSVLQQDCAEKWQLPPESLDVIFTSNFLEHLSTKNALERTLVEANRALKPGGRFVAMGPNIKFVLDSYWDFFEHNVPLTERSLAEVLGQYGFQTEFSRARFLPYTMSDGRQYPIWTLRLYLSVPLMWRFWGKQFLVVAKKDTQKISRHSPPEPST
ncbi:MAG: class I SAM-dependent methyltransferase [Candidatus Acidiferrales bacterium]